MMRLACLMLGVIFFAIASPVYAEAVKPPVNQQIPYKVVDTPLKEHGSRVGLVTLLFLIVSAGAIYFIQKKNPKLSRDLFVRKYQHIKVVEKVRLNARSTLYVLEFNHRRLLIAESGGNVTSLAEEEITMNEKSSLVN